MLADNPDGRRITDFQLWVGASPDPGLIYQAATASGIHRGLHLGRGRQAMQFGYFTLSDNHYVDNRRGANELIADILDEAIYAEEVGLHSAWIGEHHFSTLGVLSCPDLVLAHVAA